jgi:integrase/recombinase XerC
VNRPSTIRRGSTAARVVRGPDSAGQWYWRFERADGAGGKLTLASGWASPAAAELSVLRLENGQSASLPSMGTVRDLLECHLGARFARGDLTESSKRAMRVVARRLVRHLGALALSAVTRPVLERYVSVRLREPVVSHRATVNPPVRVRPGAAPRTVAGEISLLRSAWAWGREEGAVPADLVLPTVRVRVVSHQHVTCAYTPTSDEVQRVLAALSLRQAAFRDWPIFLIKVLLGTGARIGEIAGLTWDDVDLDRRTIRVRGKTGPRVVPLVAFAWEAIQGVADQAVAGARLLPAGLAAVPPLGRVLSEACSLAGVPRFTPHALRRVAVSALYGSGADPGVAGAIVGHSPAVALKHYRQVTLEQGRAALADAVVDLLVPAGHKPGTAPPGTPKQRRPSRQSGDRR